MSKTNDLSDLNNSNKLNQVKEILNKNIIPDLSNIITKYSHPQKLFILEQFHHCYCYGHEDEYSFIGIYNSFEKAIFTMLQLYATENNINKYKNNIWDFGNKELLNDDIFKSSPDYTYDGLREGRKISYVIYEVFLNSLPDESKDNKKICFHFEMNTIIFCLDEYQENVNIYLPFRHFIEQFYQLIEKNDDKLEDDISSDENEEY